MSRRVLTGAAMIVATSATIQIAAAIAHDLFGQLGPTGVTALRFALGAAVILAAVRPRLGGRNRETWLAIAVYGISLPALNLTFFEAIERLPMGVAVTFAFIAPLGMALAGSRRRRDVGFALLAAAGVLALGGIDGPGLVTLPLGVRHLDALDGRALGLGLVIAIGGLIVPFALELEGLRRLEPPQIVGMAAVIAASAGATASTTAST